jgi:hypothetical protein
MLGEQRRGWNDGGIRAGQLFLVHKCHFDRVGNCWMKGRLLEGDLIISIKHSGDSFWDYQLVEHNTIKPPTYQRGYRLIPQSTFGAYTMGDLYKFQPTDREMHLLMAGEYITLSADSESRL